MAIPKQRKTPEQIAQAIETIREFHKLGLSELQVRPGRATDMDREVKFRAFALGMNEDVYRKARQFADPERGYTAEELEILFKDFQRHRSCLTRTHILRLMAVPEKRFRRTMVNRALKEGWSVHRLQAEIVGRYGRRRAGGRRPRIATEPRQLLVQLDMFCHRWNRWCEVLDCSPGRAGEAGSARLPEDVQARVREVSRAVRRLEAELRRQREAGPGTDRSTTAGKRRGSSRSRVATSRS
jgi:hypothetical protein